MAMEDQSIPHGSRLLFNIRSWHFFAECRLVWDCYRDFYCHPIRRHSPFCVLRRCWFSFTFNVLFLYKIEINLKIIIYTFWENADISSKMYFFSKMKELLQELFPFSVIVFHHLTKLELSICLFLGSWNSSHFALKVCQFNVSHRIDWIWVRTWCHPKR